MITRRAFSKMIETCLGWQDILIEVTAERDHATIATLAARDIQQALKELNA